MIVLDIETSGLYPERHGIWQIGALDFYNPKNTFLEEAGIDDEDEITEEALKVIGKTQAKYEQIHNYFLMKGGHSDMGLSNILKFAGLEDERKEHNALEDAKLTAECFSRIINGRFLFKEFSQYKTPEYLTK